MSTPTIDTERDTNNTIQAFWVAVGSFFSYALTLISGAILSRYFSKADYGTYRQIVYVYGSLLVIFTAGLPRVYAYFLPRFEIRQGKSIVSQITKVLFLSGLVFSLFLFSFSGIIANILKNKDLEYGLKVFSPIPTLLLPTLGIEGIFSTYKKNVYIAIYNIVTRALMLIFIVLPVMLLHGTFISAIYGWLVVSVIGLIMAYFFKKIPFKGITAEKSPINYKEIFNYSIPLVIASLWGMAIKASDEFFISRYFGANVFAEYSNGFTELPFVSMVTASTSVVLMPLFSKAFHEQSAIDDLIRIWRNTMEKSALILYPLLIFAMMYSSDIMVLLYSKRYANSAIYFQINMFLNFFNIIIFAPLFLSMGKIKVYSNGHMVLAIVMWITNYIVILIFHTPEAVAINTTALSILKLFVFVFIAAKSLNIGFLDFFPFRALAMLLLHTCVIIVLVKLILSFIPVHFPVAVNLAISGAVYISLLLLTGKLFGIDYVTVVKPITNKLLNKRY